MGCNARLPASGFTHIIFFFGYIVDTFTPTDDVLGSRGCLPHRLLSTFYNANPGAQTGKILDVHVDQQGLESRSGVRRCAQHET